jgi:anti-anti-sigma factor
MALEVNITTYKDTPVLQLAGRVVDIDVKKFIRRLEMLYKKKYPKIIVDLSKTNFIDSHALGIIVYYHTMMQREKRELIICNANPHPRNYLARLFNLTNLNTVIPTIGSLEMA